MYNNLKMLEDKRCVSGTECQGTSHVRSRRLKTVRRKVKAPRLITDDDDTVHHLFGSIREETSHSSIELFEDVKGRKATKETKQNNVKTKPLPLRNRSNFEEEDDDFKPVKDNKPRGQRKPAPRKKDTTRLKPKQNKIQPDVIPDFDVFGDYDLNIEIENPKDDTEWNFDAKRHTDDLEVLLTEVSNNICCTNKGQTVMNSNDKKSSQEEQLPNQPASKANRCETIWRGSVERSTSTPQSAAAFSHRSVKQSLASRLQLSGFTPALDPVEEPVSNTSSLLFSTIDDTRQVTVDGREPPQSLHSDMSIDDVQESFHDLSIDTKFDRVPTSLENIPSRIQQRSLRSVSNINQSLRNLSAIAADGSGCFDLMASASPEVSPRHSSISSCDNDEPSNVCSINSAQNNDCAASVVIDSRHDISYVSCCSSRHLSSTRITDNRSATCIPSSSLISSQHLTPAPRPLPKSYITDLQASCRSFKEMLSPRAATNRRVRMLTPREKVLLQCGQTEPIDFESFMTANGLKVCKKIGEGAYGEVYSAKRRGTNIALKVVPIEGLLLVNDEQQKTFEEILPEIMISKEMSALREGELNMTENFVFVQSIHLVQGSYPKVLLDFWNVYDKMKGSQNDKPDQFSEIQLYVVFEFEDSGCDLEGVELLNLSEAHSVLHQVALSLAIAECAVKFEHRDLHWGNVLVKRTADTHLQYTLDGRRTCVETAGVKVAIIDFTLSRLTKDECHLFTDLSTDPMLFEGQGDYQFDIYRAMREAISDKWQLHLPYTNVLWLRYLADKLIKMKKYAKPMSNHNQLLRQFRIFLREALNFDSALAMVTSCAMFTE